ncbi:hypothetical protein OG429_03525 [Streptomyces sp. NBC_00190]|uniref:hypothetical protein n=1 Tax=Streptomyces sp. NBC_00190 TaxID=2903634 RepID=UPI002E29FF0D|nr:hypothetical protein [Streptomyces sp. NBC_00190]
MSRADGEVPVAPYRIRRRELTDSHAVGPRRPLGREPVLADARTPGRPDVLENE